MKTAINHSTQANNRGQVLPLYLVTLLVLLLSWAMVINIAKLLKDRILMQNAADNAALSVAIFRARTLNLIGISNHLMATALSSGAYPCLVPVSLFDTDHVGGSPANAPFPFSDTRCTGAGTEYHVDYSGVNRLRYTVNTIARFQELLIKSYPITALRLAQRTGSRQELNQRGEETGADTVMVVPSCYFTLSDVRPLSSPAAGSIARNLSAEKLLGLKRNKNRITYYKTVNIGVTTAQHHHFTLPRRWVTEDVSWYTVADGFPQQKLIAIAVKSGTSKDQRGYPLFKNLFGGFSWPVIITVAAAATYNTAGTMFPETDDVTTGIPDFLLPVAILTQYRQLLSLREAAAEARLIPVIGQYLGVAVEAAAAAIALRAGAALFKAEYDRNTPIKKYEEAQYAGWDAHLVPIGGKAIKH